MSTLERACKPSLGAGPAIGAPCGGGSDGCPGAGSCVSPSGGIVVRKPGGALLKPRLGVRSAVLPPASPASPTIANFFVHRGVSPFSGGSSHPNHNPTTIYSNRKIVSIKLPLL